MTLRNSYKEIMEYVTVDEAMYQRILTNISRRKAPVLRFSRPLLQRLTALAACFVIVAASIWLLPTFLSSDSPDHIPDVENGLPGFTSLDSAKELAEAVGYDVEELSSLPFSVTEVSYTAWETKMAEIKYIGAEQTAVLRKAVGDTDPSGDYTQYPESAEVAVEEWIVTLKGSPDKYCLAIWQHDGFTYSIRLSFALSQEEWIDLLSGVQ